VTGTDAVEQAGARSALDPAAVDVWLVDVEDPAFLAAAETDLPTAEDRARAGRLADHAAAARLLARRATLRLVLARYTASSPAELRLVTAPGGKPVLAPGPAFSVAHSGSLYAVAVSGATSVGVDVERRRPVARAAAIAERWFGEDEAGALARVPEEEHDAEFLRVWTAKEALAKRHGAGLRLMKGRGEESGGALDVAAERSKGRLRAFDPGPEYLGAVATTSPLRAVRLIRPTEELWTI
jgi:4'-phosphopantetheinyl transferase